jgi:cell wall-associated NlpC family hydrolase
MKKLIAIIAMTLVLTTCTIQNAGASNRAQEQEPDNTSFSFIDLILQKKQEQTMLEQQYQAFALEQKRLEKMEIRIKDLEQYVDKTWYVFSGSTPKGWDCSGLVLWFYSDLNIELPHSATKQMFSGTIVENPLPGDIVSFTTSSGKGAYHNGIYIGNGKMIHSPEPGRKTKVREITDFEKSNKLKYTRISESGKID